LEQGWRVLAVDQQGAAIEALRARVSPEAGERLETLVAPYKSLALPTADLIWAGLSLPFCRPDYFDTLWGKICGALEVGGRFAGDFFGRRHAWADSEKMTFHSKEDVLALCEGLELEYIVEEEGETNTASNGVQHWHMFTVCARKL
jgi:hypothetical protein